MFSCKCFYHYFFYCCNMASCWCIMMKSLLSSEEASNLLTSKGKLIYTKKKMMTMMMMILAKENDREEKKKKMLACKKVIMRKLKERERERKSFLLANCLTILKQTMINIGKWHLTSLRNHDQRWSLYSDYSFFLSSLVKWRHHKRWRQRWVVLNGKNRHSKKTAANYSSKYLILWCLQLLLIALHNRLCPFLVVNFNLDDSWSDSLIRIKCLSSSFPSLK